MTAHKYYKREVTTAEQFDEATWQAKYHACKCPEDWEAIAHPLSIDRFRGHFVITTLEGDLNINDGDWIATGVNGEHWPIADDIFKKTYAELPVIPRAVGELIVRVKKHQTLMRALAILDEWTSALGLSREDTDWVTSHSDTFALAWLLGEWEVAE